jgi:hypothetical protein
MRREPGTGVVGTARNFLLRALGATDLPVAYVDDAALR